MSRAPKAVRSDRQPAQFVRYFGPVLDALRSLGDSGKPGEVAERVALDLKLPDELLNEILPSGEPRYRNQVQWARLYLVKAGLIDSSRHGVWTLTERGRDARLDLDQSYTLYRELLRSFKEKPEEPLGGPTQPVDAAPPDLVEPAYKTKLLETIQSLSPSGFERLSQRILREAGFTQVEVTGRPSDGGIDGSGTLPLNAFVSIKVLFQCKRYRGSVSPSQIRDFRGAMQGRADKGIVITTGSFTTEARREASRDGVSAIELIDGGRLVEMLETLQLGLIPRQTFDVDERFFDDFRS
jgi:restriction system protein